MWENSLCPLKPVFRVIPSKTDVKKFAACAEPGWKTPGASVESDSKVKAFL